MDKATSCISITGDRLFWSVPRRWRSLTPLEGFTLSFITLSKIVVRYSWAAPCSLLGLLFATLALLVGGGRRCVSGVLEVSWRSNEAAPPTWERLLPFRAITFGHVVIGASQTQIAALREHERVHVRQYERWGVILFLAYPLSSLVQLLKGRRPYRDNRFEVEAYAAQCNNPSYHSDDGDKDRVQPGERQG